METEDYRKKILREILRVMKEKLEQGEMNAERAREIAKMVVKKLKPWITLGEIYRVVPTLDDVFPELSSVVLPVVKDYERRVEGVVKQHVGKLVKQGKFSQVSQIIDKTVKKEVPLK